MASLFKSQTVPSDEAHPFCGCMWLEKQYPPPAPYAAVALGLILSLKFKQRAIRAVVVTCCLFYLSHNRMNDIVDSESLSRNSIFTR